jgi:hypothetical protein
MNTPITKKHVFSNFENVYNETRRVWINKKREDADFCHIASCRLVQALGRFRDAYCLYHQDEDYNFHTRGHENLKTRQQQKHLLIEQYLLLTLGWLPLIKHGFKQLCKIESFNINSSVY